MARVIGSTMTMTLSREDEEYVLQEAPMPTPAIALPGDASQHERVKQQMSGSWER